MLLSIFILEDQVIQAEYMKRLVESICSEQHIPYQFIHVTSRPTELLEKISQCTYTPIYFLDIEIKNETRKGLEVAQQIRKIDDHGIIVFVTTHTEFAPISYQYMVSALTFIDKQAEQSIYKENIALCLDYYAKRNKQHEVEQYFIVENEYTTLKVPFHSVEYIMTDAPHRLQLVTTKQLIQYYGTLKEMEQIDSRLIRCHKSYLVNLNQIKAINHKEQCIELKSGKYVPVSRRLMSSLKLKLKED